MNENLDFIRKIHANVDSVMSGFMIPFGISVKQNKIPF